MNVAIYRIRYFIRYQMFEKVIYKVLEMLTFIYCILDMKERKAVQWWRSCLPRGWCVFIQIKSNTQCALFSVILFFSTA